VSGFDGELLAEVVDDIVTVHDGHHDTTTFRELEVELHRLDPHGHSVLNEIVKRLVASGAVAEPPQPKLVRALGAAAAAPPDVVVHDIVTTKKNRSDTQSLIRSALSSSVLAMVRNDAGVRLGDDPEYLHAFRVATRQLRSNLRTFATLLDPAWTTGLRSELAWLGTSLGTVRECDVLADRLHMQQPLLAQRHANVISLLHCALAAERVDAQRNLLIDMRSARYDQLLDDLIVAAKQPAFTRKHHRRLRKPAATVGTRLTYRTWKSLVKAVGAAGKHPSNDALHIVRIRAKRCRYSAEAISVLIGKPAVRFADRMKSLQDTLGAHHDAVTAQEWLVRTAAAIPMSGECVDDLIAIGIRERTEIEKAWPKLAKKLLGDKRLVGWLS
jgi:CHAD domain-containing protein